MWAMRISFVNRLMAQLVNKLCTARGSSCLPDKGWQVAKSWFFSLI